LVWDNFKFKTTMEANHDEVTFMSAYSWIPSVFEVSEDGLDVHIKSYINGLGPREEYPVLYRLIEQVFLLVLPQFERTLGHKFQVTDSKSGRYSFSLYMESRLYWSVFSTEVVRKRICPRYVEQQCNSRGVTKVAGQTSSREGTGRGRAAQRAIGEGDPHSH
jgi:hypothetical protein